MADPAVRTTRRLLVTLAAVGLLSSLLLEWIHLSTYLSPASDSFCRVGETFDCVAVAASPQSVFLGLPWALWGVVGFTGLLVAAHRLSIWLLPLGALAALTSVALFVVSLTRLGSICFVCELAHLSAVGLFVAALVRRDHLERDAKSGERIAEVLGFPALLAGALLIAVPPYWMAFSHFGAPTLPTGTTDEGHPWIGAENPEVTLHQFTDYACPHCKTASAGFLQRLGAHPEVRLVRRHHPRMGCRPTSELACHPLRAALCASDQGKFWQADRWLFAFVAPGKPVDLDRMAEDLELDLRALRACVADEDTYARANDHYKKAQRKRILGVPLYWHEETGKKVEPGELDELLAE